MNLELFTRYDDLGWSAAEIAQALGVTPRTVVRWRTLTGRRHGSTIEPLPAVLRDRARALIEDGCSRSEVARTLGVTRTTVTRWFPEYPGWSQSEGGKFARMKAAA